MSNYDDESIKSLYGAERVRKRPASMLGSNGLKGAQHGVIEMYGNAVDEASTGYGDRLDFKRYADGSISIRDYGRGVPLGWNEHDKSYNWHLVYNELYSGGKFDNHQAALRERYSANRWDDFDRKDYNYLYSVGLNGLGACSTQYTSEFFDVVSIRDELGKRNKYTMHFKKGLPIINGEPVNIQKDQYQFTGDEMEVEETDEPTGTFIHWKPDIEVFSDINITADWLLSLCEDVAYVASIDINFEDEESGRVEHIKAGTLKDLFDLRYGDKASEDTFTTNIFKNGITKVENRDFVYVVEAEATLGVATGDNRGEVSCYHNTVKMQGGVQYEAVEDAIYEFVRNQARSRGVSRLDSRDYDGLFYVTVSSYSNYASFRNQTKDAVDDLFLYSTIKELISDKLNIEFSKGNETIVHAIDRVIENAQMRIQLKEAESQIRSVQKLQKRTKNPKKFITCREYENKDYHRTELWITEGDSAKDSVVGARDSTFQAVYPIRGKGLNVFKASLAKILANQEIKDIITLVGTGIDINVKGEKLFKLEDLRFDKIIFATDADVDGFQIRVLLFCIFYKLAPKLLTEGHIFIAETPRYAVKLHDGTTEYALDEDARDKILSANAGRIAKISRFKGLGEVDAKILRETTVGVEGRNLIPVTVDFDNELERDLIDALFGSDKHHQRKEILTTVLGSEVAEELADNMRMLEEIDNTDIEEDVEVEAWD